MSNDIISEEAGCTNLPGIESLIWPTPLESHKRRFESAIDRTRLAVDWTFDLMLLLWLKVAWWSWLWFFLSILILIYKMNIAFGTSESKWMDGLEFLIHMHFLPVFLFGFIGTCLYLSPLTVFVVDGGDLIILCLEVLFVCPTLCCSLDFGCWRALASQDLTLATNGGLRWPADNPWWVCHPWSQ